MDEGEKSKGSWWATFPGVLTATAGIITAVTGLIVALHQAGLFSGGDKQGLQPPVETKPPHIEESVPSLPKLPHEAPAKEAVVPPSAQTEPPAELKAINLLSPENGAQVLLAPKDAWLQTIDGKEDRIREDFQLGEEAVFAFKDEQAARFDTFSVLILESGTNPKEFELLVGDESPVGLYRPIGKFQTQNAKFMKTGGWQEFKFPAVTAKYLKVKLLSTHQYSWINLREFRLLGQFKNEVAH